MNVNIRMMTDQELAEILRAERMREMMNKPKKKKSNVIEFKRK